MVNGETPSAKPADLHLRIVDRGKTIFAALILLFYFSGTQDIFARVKLY